MSSSRTRSTKQVTRAALIAGLLAGAALTFFSCTDQGTSGTDPKQRLQDYISKSFAVGSVDDRKELMDFLSGDARNRLAAWSEEQFRTAFIDSKRQFVKLSFQDVKQVNPKEVSITYELIFLDQGKSANGKPRDAKVTNKKLCQMVMGQDGKWYVQDVRNIKELIEFRNQLEFSLP